MIFARSGNALPDRAFGAEHDHAFGAEHLGPADTLSHFTGSLKREGTE